MKNITLLAALCLIFTFDLFAQVKKLTILHTNDHHGRFWRNGQGEYGLAARLTLIEKIREEVKAEGGAVLLLDGGDVNSGVPESDMLKAEPDFKGMRKLQYDAMAVGNHEFDNPLKVIRQQQRWAKFPFLSANIRYQDKDGTINRKGPFRPYIVKRINGLKIGIIGLTTIDTPTKTKKEHTAGLAFIEPAIAAKPIVEQFKKKNMDLIVGLTHLGHFVNANHGNDSPGDVTLARKVKGFDFIIGGHSQKPLYRPDIQNGAYIVQAYEWGKYLGRIDIEFESNGWKLKNYQLIPVNLKKNHTDNEGHTTLVYQTQKIEEDQALLNFLRPFQEKGQQRLNERVGETLYKLEGDRNYVRFRQTNLGSLIGQSMRAMTGADIAIYNSGGIRDSIAKGEITYRHILMVEPFGSMVVTARLTGEELKKYLEVALKNQRGSGGFPQISGLSAQLINGELNNIVIGGIKWAKEKTYSIATSNFSAAGGDRFEDISNHETYYNTQIPVASALKTYISEYSPIDMNQTAISEPIRDSVQ